PLFAFDLTKIGSFESKNVKAAVSSDNHTHTHVRSGGRCGTGDGRGGVFSALYVCPANQIGRFKAMYVPIAPIAYIENGSPGRSTIWFRLGVSEGMVLSSAEDLVRLLHAGQHYDHSHRYSWSAAIDHPFTHAVIRCSCPTSSKEKLRSL
ncbi:hypothetical protein M404DRAFT_998990, partial [Pisolithus tinctorius Marx 270]